jgi:hypothetical protein
MHILARGEGESIREMVKLLKAFVREEKLGLPNAQGKMPWELAADKVVQ